MASACVNNISMSPENNLHSYGWLTPRISFTDDSSSNIAGTLTKPPGESEIRDPDPELSVTDFEFRLEDPVAMLPADELFSDGKLVPRHLSSVKPLVNDLKSIRCDSAEITKNRRRVEVCMSSTDPYLYSPKAPRCSSRWRELLGLKKLYQNNSNGGKNENQKTETNSNSNSKALKYFQHRNSKSNPLESSMSLPLLKDSDGESSSRISLSSSSSSGHEHEDLHRLSLDGENKSNPIIRNQNPNQNQARIRMVKLASRAKPTENKTKTTRTGRSRMRESSGVGIRGVSVDSPRMNSSGKIVFHNLERSSSSPSSFNGGPPKFNHHLHNNRVSPVLNVPVCSLIGFGPIFSTPLKNRTRIDHKFIH